MEMVIIILLVVTVIILVIQYLKTKAPQTNETFVTTLQQLTQTAQSAHTQAAVLSEKINALGALPQISANIQVELRSLAERISTVEDRQNRIVTDVNTLQARLAETTSITQTIASVTGNIQNELNKAKEGLTELQTSVRAREELERRTAESIRRLEAVIAGTQTKGDAGENILEVVFSKLPTEWQVRNFKVNNRSVEFAIRLPNNLILPIDSKWPATNLIEKFTKSNNPEEQRVLKKQIEDAVLNKAEEVTRYIDPNLTVNFGIAAVPDAVYELSSGILVDVFRMNVVLISYSMFLPYLLLVFHTILKTSQNIRLDKLNAYLETVQSSIEALQDELEGRFSRAIVMLDNSRRDMNTHLSKVTNGLAGLRLISNETNSLPPNHNQN